MSTQSVDRCESGEGEQPCDPADVLDRQLRALAARATSGLSVIGLVQAWQDWAQHLATSPFKRLSLAQEAVTMGVEAALHPDRRETAQDPRFRGEPWRMWPFNYYATGFQAAENWWKAATTEVEGVTDQHKRVAAFVSRQMLDVFSPSNFLLTNPEVLARTASTGGLNLMRGGVNATLDALNSFDGRGQDHFRVGQEVATTPGKVVARTRLAEIIQYSPATDKVRPEPVVIVPAWIMKYYILDLTPAESMVRALVEQGFTVFIVSWKNPTAAERDCGFDDYMREGALTAIDTACRITGSPKVHGVGYCVGGTLMAMTAATMARDGDDRLASLTLLAAQADFTEAGELSVFINESEVALLEDLMWDRGYLKPEQMAGAFQLLRSNDLIWSRIIHGYLMGETREPTSLDAWSQDATRLPFRMESQNLRSLYMNDDVAEGRFKVGGRPIALRDIEADMFVLGTETDHIAPWRSVYKLLLLTDADITFALTNHGHNTGVVSPLDSPRRRYRLHHQTSKALYLDPDTLFEQSEVKEGSWWAPWFDWLAAHSGPPVAPPPLGEPGAADLGDAPGTYVLER
ncbi:PHA/PHB synthase family protein [Phenylobacterium sp.]|uniref:PHA/PHB synthase family protein n=1 Tax=Phenylobacterium sp. TaxID=1871053 RepID=UPI0035B01AD2